jgi:uncharacterized protein (DUF433 family)
MSQPILTCSPEVLGGTPVFAGTRVPVQTLLDYLEGGETIDDFLEGFPTVKREQVIAFLQDFSPGSEGSYGRFCIVRGSPWRVCRGRPRLIGSVVSQNGIRGIGTRDWTSGG